MCSLSYFKSNSNSLLWNWWLLSLKKKSWRTFDIFNLNSLGQTSLSAMINLSLPYWWKGKMLRMSILSLYYRTGRWIKLTSTLEELIYLSSVLRLVVNEWIFFEFSCKLNWQKPHLWSNPKFTWNYYYCQTYGIFMRIHQIFSCKMEDCFDGFLINAYVFKKDLLFCTSCWNDFRFPE